LFFEKLPNVAKLIQNVAKLIQNGAKLAQNVAKLIQKIAQFFTIPREIIQNFLVVICSSHIIIHHL